MGNPYTSLGRMTKIGHSTEQLTNLPRDQCSLRIKQTIKDFRSIRRFPLLPVLKHRQSFIITIDNINPVYSKNSNPSNTTNHRRHPSHSRDDPICPSRETLLNSAPPRVPLSIPPLPAQKTHSNPLPRPLASKLKISLPLTSSATPLTALIPSQLLARSTTFRHRQPSPRPISNRYNPAFFAYKFLRDYPFYLPSLPFCAL